MKKILMLFFAVVSFWTNSYSQSEPTDNLPIQPSSSVAPTEPASTASAPSQPGGQTAVNSINGKESNNASKIGFWKGFIAFMPVLMFIIIIPIVFASLNRGGYKISDSLKEKDTIKLRSATTARSDAAGPQSVTTNSQDVMPNSSSRLIAFLTGFTTIIITVCLTTFWMYKSFESKEVDLKGLTALFVTLGIGVIPYGANRLTGAFKNPNSTDSNN